MRVAEGEKTERKSYRSLEKIDADGSLSESHENDKG
jgi:hypothetical protein